MEYEDIVDRLAPCGLDCSRCIYYDGGIIKRSALELREALTGFDNVAPMVAKTMAPVLRHYGHFREVLDLFAGATCEGCRAGGPTLPFCAARVCFREKEVDFCFQCDEYPCGRNTYPPNLAARWRRYNDRMREVGVERFYEESLQRPRYE
jgi:hypothetical protein